MARAAFETAASDELSIVVGVPQADCEDILALIVVARRVAELRRAHLVDEYRSGRATAAGATFAGVHPVDPGGAVALRRVGDWGGVDRRDFRAAAEVQPPRTAARTAGHVVADILRELRLAGVAVKLIPFRGRRGDQPVADERRAGGYPQAMVGWPDDQFHERPVQPVMFPILAGDLLPVFAVTMQP